MSDIEHQAASDNIDAAKALRKLAIIHSPDPIAQAAALLTAATAIIEAEVGTAMAPGALFALLEPTLNAWQTSPRGRPH